MPLCIDLFCGLGGWAEGFLAEGWDVIRFDIERHDYGTGGYPGQLVLQDVLTLHGSQFRNADVIVASSPCQFFSRMAMPFKCPWGQAEFEKRRDLALSLFNACARIQSEASEARTLERGCKRCGIYHPATVLDGCDLEPWRIPMVQENVVGAQRWVGRAAWHFGSYYLWGDVPALMPPSKIIKVGHPERSYRNGDKSTAPDGRKCPGLNWNGHGSPDYKPKGFNVTNTQRLREQHGKQNEDGGGTKVSGDWFGSYADQKAAGTISSGRLYGKNSDFRKAASAHIAKIPFPLAQHIARVYKP